MEAYREQDPSGYNRLVHLLECVQPNPSFELSILEALLGNDITFADFLRKFEVHLCKRAGYNFILYGVPGVGTVRETGLSERIESEHMFDTLNQFGKLHRVHMNGDAVYAKFQHRNESVKTHRMINGMMMGESIIKTMVC